MQVAMFVGPGLVASEPDPVTVYSGPWRPVEMQGPRTPETERSLSASGFQKRAKPLVPSGYPSPAVESTKPPQPTRSPRPSSKPRARTTPRPSSTGHSASGVPTYYCRAGVSRCTRGYPDRAGVADYYAAAGPSLRVGKWRGRIVTVHANGRTLRVRLVDFCACGGNHFLDLYWDAFKALGRPSHAKVTW